MIQRNLYGTGGYGTLSSSAGGDSSPAASGNNNDSVQRPKSVFYWTNGDVMKWLQRAAQEFYGLYGTIFLENDITGRSLIRINEETLERMGIKNAEHREQIARIILKLKLKSDMLQFKELEKKGLDSNAMTNTLPKASQSPASKTFANYIR